jgi:hypothetical protein
LFCEISIGCARPAQANVSERSRIVSNAVACRVAPGASR